MKEISTTRILPYHTRYYNLHIIGLIGGVYQPTINGILKSKSLQILFRTYANVINFLLLIYLFLVICNFFTGQVTLSQRLVDLCSTADGLNSLAIVIWYNFKKNEVFQLNQHWMNDFGNDKFVDKREAIIRNEVSKLEKVMSRLTSVIVVTVSLWFTQQYFLEDKKVKMATVIPYRHQSPDFEIVLTFYFSLSVLVLLSSHAVHITILLPIIWQIGALENLTLELETILNIADLYQNEDLPEKAQENIEKRLQAWILVHQSVMLFHKKTQKILKIPISLKMTASFMAFWLMAINAIESTDMDNKSLGISYLAPVVLMFKIICNYCDKLFEKGIGVADVAFTKNWHILPKNIKRQLLVISMQTNRPLLIKGFGIFPTNSQTFAKIIQSAYSVLNFLVATVPWEDTVQDDVLTS